MVILSSTSMHKDDTKSVGTTKTRPPPRLKQSKTMKTPHFEFINLPQVESEITAELQKLKMECLESDVMTAMTNTCTRIHQESNCRMSQGYLIHFCKFYPVFDRHGKLYKLVESREAISTNPPQEESEVIANLQILKKNLVKCTSFGFLDVFNRKQNMEWKVKDLEKLTKSFHELYVSSSRKPRQMKHSNMSSQQLIKKNIMKLQQGSMNLVKEREFVKQMKQAKEVEKINANVEWVPPTRVYARGGDILDTKRALSDYIKVALKEVEELKKEIVRCRFYDGLVEDEKAATEKEIKILETKLDNIYMQNKFQSSQP